MDTRRDAVKPWTHAVAVAAAFAAMMTGIAWGKWLLVPPSALALSALQVVSRRPAIYRILELLILYAAVAPRRAKAATVTICDQPIRVETLVALAAAACLVAVRALWGRGTPSLARTARRIGAVMCVLWVCGLAALAVGSSTMDEGLRGVVAGIELLVPMAILPLVLNVKLRAEDALALLVLVVVCLAGNALIAMGTCFFSEAAKQTFGWQLWRSLERGLSAAGSAVTTAGLLAMVLPLLLAWAASARYSPYVWAAGAAVVGGLAVTQTRAALYTIGLVAPATLLMMRARVRMLPLVIATVLIVAPVGIVASRTPLHRFLVLIDVSAQHRVALAQEAFGIVAGSKGLGAGWATVYLRPPYPRRVLFGERWEGGRRMEPHSLYLLMATEMGLPALAAYFVLLGIIGSALVSRCRSAAAEHPTACGMVSGYVAVVLFEAFNSDIALLPSFAVVVWTFIACGLVYMEHYRRIRTRPHAAGRGATGEAAASIESRGA